jgi:hypothetical protein
MTETTDPVALPELVRGLPAVATHLEPEEVASILTQAMNCPPFILSSYALSELSQQLSASMTRDPRDSPVRAACLVAGLGVSDRQPLLATTVTVLGLEPLPCRFSTQELVELLKHPLCVDRARRVVLEQLERRYRRTFADHWEFVRFAQQQGLGLDFTTPPRRPEVLLPQARK